MTSVFINEFHYDNTGTDTGEFVEIAAPITTDLTGWSLVLYNGSNGTAYSAIALGAISPIEQDGVQFLTIDFPTNGIQNGSPDGLALVSDTGSVVQFLSYEGEFTAVDGPAAGVTSTDIGIAESSDTSIGFSLQLSGTGSTAADFTFGAAIATPGTVNDGQTLVAATNHSDLVVRINEVLVSTTGSDVEFIEIFGTPGTSLAGLSVLNIEGGTGAGSIDNRFDLPSAAVIGENGFYLLGNSLVTGTLGVIPDTEIPANFFENSSSTIALVETATLTGTAVSGSETVIDAVALSDANGGTFFYDAPVLGPDGSFYPSAVTRTPDGSDFQLIDAFSPAGANTTPTAGTGDDGDGDGGGDAPLTLISAIQGEGAASALVGNTVTIEAIVVGDFQDGDAGTNGDFNGFFVQEEDTDSDGNVATSEGLFIFDGNNPAVDVQVGDRVRVTGTVAEFFGETQLSGVTVEVIDSRDNSGLVTPATITFPVAATTTNSDGALIADLEAYEGMLVTIPQELTVSDLFTLGRFGDMSLYAEGRLETYTQGSAPSVAGFQAYQELAVRNTVVLDDGSTVQNPAVIPFEIPSAPGDVAGQLDANDELSAGDTLTNLTGVVRYSRGSGGSGDEIYRINPTATAEFVNSNPRPTAAPAVGGRLTVASFNVLNFFTSLGDEGLTAGPNGLSPRGADNAVEFDRQLAKLVAALAELKADVFGLVELENEFGDVNGDGEFAIGVLTEALNAAIPGANYQFVDPGTDYVGTDAIAVGFIYNANTVGIAAGTTVEVLSDGDLAGLGLNFGNPVFDGAGTSRSPIAVTFEELATGETFTAVNNHFKSKGSISPFGDNAGIGDGTGNNNEARLQAAIAVETWLKTDPTGSGDADVLILGDLNAYAQEDPIQYLRNAGYTDLVADFLPPGESIYSFGFPLDLDTSPQVQAFGALDYALANGSLATQVVGAAEWHINADEASAFDYNTNFKPNAQISGLFGANPFRSSDHDPLIVGLNLDTPLDRVNDYTIFNRELNGTDFTVNLIDGLPVYEINGSVAITTSVNEFLQAAVATLAGDVSRNGQINDGALEHFGGHQNPFVRKQPNRDRVHIGGAGISGQFRADFDSDSAASAFQAFAADLLGNDPAPTEIFAFQGGTNGGTNRIQIFANDELIGLNASVGNGFGTLDSFEFRWSGAQVRGRQTTNNLDDFIEAMGVLFDGVQIQDGNVNGFGNQTQAQLVGDELNRVDLGSRGVGGQEVYEFDNQAEAQTFLTFFNGVVDAFAGL